MSCRVLGRRVEQAVLQELVARAQQCGVSRLVGTYHPTQRNRLVEDHYSKLGFADSGHHGDGSSQWRLDVSDYQETSLPMKIVRLPA